MKKTGGKKQENAAVREKAVNELATAIFDSMRRADMRTGYRQYYSLPELQNVFRTTPAVMLSDALALLRGSDAFGRKRVVDEPDEQFRLGPEFALPDDIVELVQDVIDNFPTRGPSNPFYFALLRKAFDECGQPRAGAYWYAFELCVASGILKKLPEGEEYAWTGTAERAAPQPVAEPPRPAQAPQPEIVTVPPPISCAAVDTEALCRELAWRAACGELPERCRKALAKLGTP